MLMGIYLNALLLNLNADGNNNLLFGSFLSPLILNLNMFCQANYWLLL